jgi:mRNA-degrading endonuclease RelE of RelBE toxin-antitoxin system
MHTDPLIIERRVAVPEKTQRKIIIEHLPAPPPKPRDIIIEKWLPRDYPTRSICYQNNLKDNRYSRINSQQALMQQLIEHQSRRNYHDLRSIATATSTNSHSLRQLLRPNRSFSSDFAYPLQSHLPSQYCQHIYSPVSSLNQNITQQNDGVYYTPQYQQNGTNRSKIAGYRIIRQIIPGPNSSQAEIERALLRSQRISSSNKLNTNQQKIYSPFYDYATNSTQFNEYPIYSRVNTISPDSDEIIKKNLNS